MLRKRDDGFHDIETVFLRIPWSDEIFARPADSVTMTASDSRLPVDDRNLIIKTATLLRNAHGFQGGVQFYLDKHVPFGAGLGGGSSDAAAAMLLLNELWKLNLSASTLQKAALQLGSDVAFFLGAETALGHGRGEILMPLDDPTTGEPYRPPFALVVAVPQIHVSTAEAYDMVAPHQNERADLREIILSNNLERWTAELTNDFERAIFAQHPAIADLKMALLDAGAGYAAMSGSGSAVYGFFEEDRLARAAAEILDRWNEDTTRQENAETYGRLDVRMFQRQT